MTLASEAYRIAEEAHKGVDESYIKDLCTEAARTLGLTMIEVYRASKAAFVQHFDRAY